MGESEIKNQLEGDFLYRELITKSKMGYVSPSVLAVASATVGRNEDAIRYTIQALDIHDPYYIVLIMDRPDNRALRSLPEFKEIMKIRGLH